MSYVLTQSDVDVLRELLAKVRDVRGRGVGNSAGFLTLPDGRRSAAPSQPTLQRMIITEVATDHVVARVHDGTDTATGDIVVAKPEALWGSVYGGDVASPLYTVNQQIWATFAPGGGTGVAAATWLEVLPHRSVGPIWAEITSATSLGSNQWEYAATQRAKTTTGWASMSGAISITGMRNSIEANNSGTGVEGHGVDVDGDDYPIGFAVQPIATGAIVRAWPELVSSTVVWSCEVINADDGTCS